ncbi:PREDICTED: zinc finger SWIM domain-containing protein 3 [Nanorana parkeri]|uniref:zinc finger SWIM domain-containing protein 3 n=1 Tax=Nanorana parkeri TaxID=125878 RepID=UPI00085420EA|nr:PREDICTED: zinc finger SWIM domain-containing protein 3 [Nanorana parkeri]
MQRGTCFINYEDFRECFDCYKKETRSSYSIHSCVSVQRHNSRHGTNIRDDVIYTQVKFCCSKLQGHNGKRKSLEVICPAYFFLQYDATLDRLVVKEECPTHVHTKQTSLQVSPPTFPLELVHSECRELDSQSKKICGETISLPVAQEYNDENLHLHVPSEYEESLPLDGNDSEVDFPDATLDCVQEVLSIDAISRLGELMKNFQTKDLGSKALLSVGSEQQLEQISFQTSKMCGFFLKFPESLLIHKVVIKRGYTVYAFLVENKERTGKVINFSFVREDNAKEISKMMETFKNFNPEWKKVKIIYTDIGFGHRDTLRESFPSARTLLSVFHTVHFIEREIKGSTCFKEWLRKWIDDAIHHTTPEKLNTLAEQIQYKLDKELYEDLYTNWFSCELLWYLHMKKGLHFSNMYMDSLGLVTDTISSLLSKDVPTEEKIQQFVESADCFNSKGLENKRDGCLDFSKNIARSPKKKKVKVKSIIKSRRSAQPSMKKSSGLPKVIDASENKPKPLPSRLQKVSDKMLLSLKNNCNDLGFRLCFKEWEAVQKSSQLISVQTDCILVRFLEESHQVSQGGLSCTCYFSTLYKLPCRHILAMLLANKKLVDRDMVNVRWHKRSIKPVSHSKIWDTVLCNANSADEANRRVDMINSLVMEFENLLLQVDEAEKRVRSSTLQIIVDMWQKESNAKKDHLAQNKTDALPLRWVKKESVEGEADSDCCELYRLDT